MIPLLGSKRVPNSGLRLDGEVYRSWLAVQCRGNFRIESQPGEITRAAGLVTSGQYRSIVIEDMDDDGNLDVVAGGSNPGTIKVWYGDGHGRLSEFQSLPSG